MFARPAQRTMTIVAAGRIQTAALNARYRRTMVLGLLAHRAKITDRTDAHKLSDHVNAFATVTAR